MAGSAMRLVACAGLLTAGLLMAGAGVGVAVADTGDSAGPSRAPAPATSKPGGGSKGANGATNPGSPTSTIGNGRQDVDIKSTNEQKKTNDNPIGPKKFNGSLTIPVLRVPNRDELPASGWPDPRLFYTTVVIPTLRDVFAALQPTPEPTPTPTPTRAPAPAVRTEVEAPAPVADSGGGGVEPPSHGVASEPPVLRAPMVVAPIPMVVAPIPIPMPRPAVVAPVAPLGMSAGAGPKQAVAVDVATAGARAPLIRGSLPPTAMQPQAKVLTPTSEQTTRLGYARYLRDPTETELAVIALPGVTGLLFLTFIGGFIGYRQANSARFIRVQGAERFLR
jgi:hypothetical protein